MLVYNGMMTNGELQFGTNEDMINILEPIALGNTVAKQEENEASRILNAFIKELPTENGAQIPVERFNVTINEGGFTSDSMEFQKRVEHFDFKKEDFIVTGFQYDVRTLLKARGKSGGMSKLMEEARKKVQAIADFYVNTYLPSQKAITMITGTSLSLSVPSLNNGGKYSDGVGALRGEDMSDLLMSVVKDRKQRNHYLGKAGAVLATSDIQNTSRKITEYFTYSKQGVLAMANRKTMDDLINVYGYAGTKDELVPLALPVTVIAGVSFYPLDIIPDGKIVFIDAGEKELIYNAVEEDPEQVGMGIFSNKASNFESLEDLMLTQIVFWSHGMFVFKREKIAWLDIDNQGVSDGLGNYVMHGDGIAEMDNWAASLREGLTQKPYIA